MTSCQFAALSQANSSERLTPWTVCTKGRCCARGSPGALACPWDGNCGRILSTRNARLRDGATSHDTAMRSAKWRSGGPKPDFPLDSFPAQLFQPLPILYSAKVSLYISRTDLSEGPICCFNC